MDSLGGYKDKLYFCQKKSNDYEILRPQSRPHVQEDIRQSSSATDKSPQRSLATQRRRADTRDRVSAYKTCARTRRPTTSFGTL